MCMEFWHEYIARTLQVRRCTAPFSRLMVGTLARSGGRLGGIHTAVVTRGATLSFCSFGHGTASDPVNVTNAVAGAGAEAADRAIVQIKEALHGALSGISDWRFWTRPVSGGFVSLESSRSADVRGPAWVGSWALVVVGKGLLAGLGLLLG
jgi:hypothetical protein